jgi:hypothetical protein
MNAFCARHRWVFHQVPKAEMVSSTGTGGCLPPSPLWGSPPEDTLANENEKGPDQGRIMPRNS